LLDIGIQKKRLVDCFYYNPLKGKFNLHYHGLKGKFNGFKNVDLKDDNVIEKLMKERDADLFR